MAAGVPTRTDGRIRAPHMGGPLPGVGRLSGPSTFLAWISLSESKPRGKGNRPSRPITPEASSAPGGRKFTPESSHPSPPGIGPQTRRSFVNTCSTGKSGHSHLPRNPSFRTLAYTFHGSTGYNRARRARNVAVQRPPLAAAQRLNATGRTPIPTSTPDTRHATPTGEIPRCDTLQQPAPPPEGLPCCAGPPSWP